MIIKNIYKYTGFIIALLCALSAFGPLGLDSFLAALPIMGTYFGVNMAVIKLTITFYFLGYALGSFFGGPSSDSFGRKPIILLGIIIYGISSLLITLASRIEWVLFYRLIQGFGGGFTITMVSVFIHDRFQGNKVAKFITLVSMIMMLAPVFAPIIGYFFIQFIGWKGVFYFLFTYSIILFLLFLLIRESRNPSLITNKITANQLLKQYKIFFSYRQPVLLLLSISFSMAGIYIFLTEASYIYIQYFKIEQKFFPLLFAGNIILNIFFSIGNIRLLKSYHPQTLARLGFIIQLIAGIALFITVEFMPSFWIVFCLISIFIGAIGLIFGNGSAIIIKYNAQVSGAASANISIFRFILGFLLGSIVALFHSNSLIPMGTGMFCCALIANVLFAIFTIEKSSGK